MAVIFDFEAGKDFHFSSAFGKHFDREVTHDRVFLPESLGEGFIQEVYLNNGLSLCLHRYTLRQEFVLRRHSSEATDVLTMKFDGRRKPAQSEAYDEVAHNEKVCKGKGCEVEFGTSNFFTELKIPPHEEINFLVIVTTRQTLLHLLQLGEEGAEIESAIRENSSFVLHEEMTGEMERTLLQISQINEMIKLPALLYQAKAEELIYLLFSKLFSRHTRVSVSVNREDAEKIYGVRTAILADLSAPPQLPGLARNIGMSPTKMKQLFRQIFGDSIYNYYQSARMNEAANLLKNFSVSQVGYSIGFSNLSHFTRLFDRHHRMKPKRYKDSII